MGEFRERSVMVSMLRLSQRGVNLVNRAVSLANACLVGVWLGLFRRRHLHILDRQIYDGWQQYASPEYLRGGLFAWEQVAVESSFPNSGKLVLIGAGAGRETIALLERGYEVDGFECHGGLRRVGNSMLASLQRPEFLQPMERDICPALTGPYDGVILCWAVLSLIQGRTHRVRLLEGLHSATAATSPLLLSFYSRTGDRGRYGTAARIGTVLCRVLRRPPVEIGDYIVPNFVHAFTREELESELSEAGWRLARYRTDFQPHAVAVRQ